MALVTGSRSACAGPDRKKLVRNELQGIPKPIGNCGSAIVQGAELSSAVTMASPGQLSALEVWRDGRLVSVTVTLGEADSAEPAPSPAATRRPDAAPLGLKLRAAPG